MQLAQLVHVADWINKAEQLSVKLDYIKENIFTEIKVEPYQERPYRERPYRGRPYKERPYKERPYK